MQKITLAHRESHIHRILADDEREVAAFRADDVSRRQIGFADFPGDGRYDIGVAQIAVRIIQFCLIRHYIACGPLVLSKGLIARSSRASALREQVRSTFQLDCSQRLCGLAPLQGTLGLLYGCLIFAFLDVIQMVAFRDFVALLEEDLFKIAFYSGLDLDPINGLYATDKIARLLDLLALSKDGSDWRRFFLSPRGKNTQAHQNWNCATTCAQAEKPVSSAA